MSETSLPLPTSTDTTRYFIETPAGKIGPLDSTQIKLAVDARQISAKTFLLRDGGSEWVEAGKALPALFPLELAQIAAATAPVTPSSMVFAGFWVKFGALILDSLIVSIASGLSYGISLLLDFTVILAPLGILLDIVTWVATVVYAPYFIVREGRTIGMRVMGLKMRTEGGGTIPLRVAIGRGFAAILSIIPFGLGFLWSVWTPRNQTWHDRLAGTVVVVEP